MITPIIPSESTFYDSRSGRIEQFAFKKQDDLDLKSICIFTALGFFLGDSTYFEHLKTLEPATEYEVKEGVIQSSSENWAWNYNPREISFKQTLEEFSELFEKISLRQTKDKKVILPLSGGLDSRSQAAVLPNNSQVSAYSYQFQNGINENKYGEAIARAKGFTFKSMTIPKGYLWDGIEHLAKLNHCLSDFTHQRQMAVRDEYPEMGDLFFLGHWGDVLFDDMGVKENLTEKDMLESIYKKVIKKGGQEIGQILWDNWGLSGSFEAELKERISKLLSSIHIEDANAKIRAFKSKFWAPRWTSTNLCVFRERHEIALPYYDDEMCRFICTVPEKYLGGRQIQIEYMKTYSPELARIPWQSFDPCNLYNYKDYYSTKYLPLRTFRNINRRVNKLLSGGVERVTRNWEIQFLGDENERKLHSYLYENKEFTEWIPKSTIDRFLLKFKKEDAVKYSHPVSMLLTLSVFSKLRSGNN